MSSKKTPNKNYDVGYGKPPKKHQFKKGQSGNPKGRPKKEEPIDAAFKHTQFQNAFLHDAEQTLNIKMNGREIPMRKIEAIVMQLGNKALQGCTRSAKLYFQYHKDFSFTHDEQLNELRDILYDIDQRDAQKYEDMPVHELIDSMTKRWKGRAVRREYGTEIPFEAEEPVSGRDWSAWYQYASEKVRGNPDSLTWPPAYWDDGFDPELDDIPEHIKNNPFYGFCEPDDKSPDE